MKRTGTASQYIRAVYYLRDSIELVLWAIAKYLKMWFVWKKIRTVPLYIIFAYILPPA